MDYYYDSEFGVYVIDLHNNGLIDTLELKKTVLKIIKSVLLPNCLSVSYNLFFDSSKNYCIIDFFNRDLIIEEIDEIVFNKKIK